MPSPDPPALDLEEIESALQFLSQDLNSNSKHTATIISKPHALKTLAEGSRQSSILRQRLSHPSVLKALIQIIEKSCQNSSSDLEITDAALRCLANACIGDDGDDDGDDDDDGNDNHNSARDHISLLGFKWAVACLSSSSSFSSSSSASSTAAAASKLTTTTNTSIKLLMTKVLNNICYDHEGVQKACYRDKVHFALLRFLSTDVVRKEISAVEGKVAVATAAATGELDGAIDVLFWVSGQKGKGKGKVGEEESPSSSSSSLSAEEVLPKDVLDGILKLYELWTEECGVETFATLSETMLVWLRDEGVQKQIVDERRFGDVWGFLETQEGLIEELKRAQRQVDEDGEWPLPPYCQTGNLEEDQKLLVPLQASLVWCLSDIAANPGFSKVYDWAGEDMQFLLHIIQSAANNVRGQTRSLYSAKYEATSAAGQKFNAACQILGNLLWAQSRPEDYARLVEGVGLHKDLIDIIALGGYDAAFPDTLHSIAGLLVQLSRPTVEVREMMGSYKPTCNAVERLCRHERPEIKQGGIKLVKALGEDCQANQRRFADLARAAMAAMQPASGDHGGDTDSVMAVDRPV